MNAHFQPTATIEHGVALCQFVNRELKRQNRRAIYVCADAGLSSNTIAMLRHNPRRAIKLPTAVALLNALGYRLDAVPIDGQAPAPIPSTPSERRSKGQQRRQERRRAEEYAALRAARLEADRVIVNGLRGRLRDLRASIQHKRHHDDLLNELDDLIFVLEKEARA